MKQKKYTGILLKKVDYGDYDIILTFFTKEFGKLSCIAKSAKKSRRRFPGILEHFCRLKLVITESRGLPVLKEACLEEAFENIRGSIRKTAYAAYWSELICEWAEEYTPSLSLFCLLEEMLKDLDSGGRKEEALSILFQIRFLMAAGFKPNLTGCAGCGLLLDAIPSNRIFFDLKKGGLFCEKCCNSSDNPVNVSKGTIKQMLWLEQEDMGMVKRIRFSDAAITEAGNLLEKFVSYHIDRKIKSLDILRQFK